MYMYIPLQHINNEYTVHVYVYINDKRKRVFFSLEYELLSHGSVNLLPHLREVGREAWPPPHQARSPAGSVGASGEPRHQVSPVEDSESQGNAGGEERKREGRGGGGRREREN